MGAHMAIAGGGLQPPPGLDETKLRRACQDFEGLFLSMLFRAMRSTVPRDGLLSGGSAGELFESVWADELGSQAARSSPLRIADVLFSALDQRTQESAGADSSPRLPLPNKRLKAGRVGGTPSAEG